MISDLPDWVFRSYSPEPYLVLIIGSAVILYTLGLARLWRRAGTGNGISIPQAAAFVLGIAALAFALSPMMEAAASVLFSAHMTQHMLLAYLAAPLLAYSLSGLAFMWALPAPARKNLARTWQSSAGLRAVTALLTSPVVVWVLFAVTFWLWHVPALYGIALAVPAVHVLEHVMMFGSAGLFWWLVLQPSGRRRLPHGAAILFVFATLLQGMFLSSLLAFAQQPQYEAYILSAQVLGISALNDQQLAGMIMRTPATVILVVTCVWLFIRWLSGLERHDLEFG